LQTPLNASASTAGALLSSSIFEVPQFQREYSWQDDEVADFWNDLSKGLDSESYFLGLIILTDEGGKKHVVDGQQRLITLSLLANAIYFEAQSRGRAALADRIRADFLRSIDYDSDETNPRVVLSDEDDNRTFQLILDTGLLEAQVRGEKYGRVVFVSLDKKLDWSRAGMAHPILTAEVRALLNVPFEIWTIDRLATEIAAVA
jgi:hypothetical protein